MGLKRVVVPYPDDAIAASVGNSAEVPNALLEEAQHVALRGSDLPLFAAVQAITVVAHQTNKNPDVRFAMERLAGDYLAASVPCPPQPDLLISGDQATSDIPQTTPGPYEPIL